MIGFADKIAMLDDLQGILGACRVGKTRQLTQDLNYRRAGELPPVLLHPLRPDRVSQSGGDTLFLASIYKRACLHSVLFQALALGHLRHEISMIGRLDAGCQACSMSSGGSHVQHHKV